MRSRSAYNPSLPTSAAARYTMAANRMRPPVGRTTGLSPRMSSFGNSPPYLVSTFPSHGGNTTSGMRAPAASARPVVRSAMAPPLFQAAGMVSAEARIGIARAATVMAPNATSRTRQPICGHASTGELPRLCTEPGWAYCQDRSAAADAPKHIKAPRPARTTTRDRQRTTMTDTIIEKGGRNNTCRTLPPSTPAHIVANNHPTDARSVLACAHLRTQYRTTRNRNRPAMSVMKVEVIAIASGDSINAIAVKADIADLNPSLRQMAWQTKAQPAAVTAVEKRRMVKETPNALMNRAPQTACTPTIGAVQLLNCMWPAPMVGVH